MFVQKNHLFLELTKNQKSFLVSFLKNFTKKNQDLSDDEILDQFIEDENYYYEVGNPHFEWIMPWFEDEKFLKEIKSLIKQYKLQIQEKERQKPFIEKQKAYAKEQRKKAQEYKLSKEKPTEKQLKYYTRLCKKYKIEKVDTSDLSKLDLKNMISEILEKTESEVYKCLEKN